MIKTNQNKTLLPGKRQENLFGSVPLFFVFAAKEGPKPNIKR